MSTFAELSLVCLQRSSCIFFFSILFCSPSHTNIHAPQTKDGSCLSHWSGNWLEGSGFRGQTAPRHHGWAACHSASHRLSVKWQSRQGHPRPAPPMCSCSSIYSNSRPVLQACAAPSSPVKDIVELITLISMGSPKGPPLSMHPLHSGSHQQR